MDTEIAASSGAMSVAPAPTTTVQAVLDFALTIEIFENELYKAVLGTSASTAQNGAFATVRVTAATVPGLVPSLQLLQQQEAAHVATLVNTGATNVFNLDANSFDFTGNRNANGGGPFAAATTDLPFLLVMAQSLEDASVRAYKGQIPDLSSDPARLELAIRIHSVEARHAARLRRIRRNADTANTNVPYSGTIVGGLALAAGAGTQSAAVSAVLDRIYGQGTNILSAPSEANTIQAGVDVSRLRGAQFGTLTLGAAQVAFDEPLTRGDVLPILQPFFIPKLS